MAEEGFLFLGFLLLLFWRLGLVVAEDCYCLVLPKNVKKNVGFFCVMGSLLGLRKKLDFPVFLGSLLVGFGGTDVYQTA